MDITAEEINIDLKNHQIHADDWDQKLLAENLHIWSERFIIQFKLECTVPVLKLDRFRSNSHGYFRIGRNGFGLLNEIAINEKYVNGRTPDFDNLGTLLHELLHSEQQTLGTAGKTARCYNYHNTAYIKRAKSFGLIVDHQGNQTYAPPPTPFSELLGKYGVHLIVPLSEVSVSEEIPVVSSDNSKLKLWVCSCQPKPVRVRVAIPDFRAKCLKCGQIFTQKVKLNH